MTGFGQAAGENDRHRMSLTLRGVNHRYLDLAFRGRDERRELEPVLRKILSRRLWRGRVEIGLEVTELGERVSEIEIDEAALTALRERGDALTRRGLLTSSRLDLADLLRLPNLVRFESRDRDWQEDDFELLRQITGEATEQMVTARRVEGGKLRAVLEQRLAGLAEGVARIQARVPAAAEDVLRQLRRRLAELLDGEAIDPDRLAQEVAILADRSDVSEELDRLQSHLEHYSQILDQDGSIGRRLDFLAQEVLRELNTIGSKCRDSAMTREVLEGKAICEQIREQVQNVE